MEIDKRKLYQELKSDYDEIANKLKELDEDWKGDFEGTEEYHKYMYLKEKGHDDVAKDKYAKWYDAEQEMDSLKAKSEEYKKAAIDAAKDLNKELNEKIAEIEKKIEVNNKHIEKVEAEIEAKKQEIAALKETEEYKNGDQETLLKLGDLESELAQKESRRDEIKKSTKEISEELGQVKSEREELVDVIKDEFDVDINDSSAPETSKEPDEVENKEPEIEEKGKDKNKGAKNKEKDSNVVVVANGNNEPELSEEEKAKKEQQEKEEKEKKEQEEKDKKLKEDFEDLKVKAKKGNLTDKDFESLVVIMKNKENYEKLGITTGVVFNKSRGIFKALNKYAGEDEQKLASVKEAYNEYTEVFYEKHGEKKLNMLSKFLVIDEVESRNQTPALPETTTEEKASLGDELTSKTVSDEEYKDIETKSAPSIDEQEQTK